MNPFTLLMAASLVGVAALFLALAIFLLKIIRELEIIGGERITPYGAASSYLSKIRLGVRAIEVQAAALPVQLTRLNGGLTAVRDGLKAIDDNLTGVIDGVSRQQRGRGD